MAEVSIATLETAGAPSMVAGTEEAAYMRLVASHGPFKVETILYQQAAANDFAADATANSNLAHPLFATIVPVTDLDNTAFPGSVDLTSDESNANFKQLTLRNCESINGLGVCIQVFGF